MKLPHLNLRKIRGFLYQHKISATVILVAILAAVGALIYYLPAGTNYLPPALRLTPKKVDNRVEAPLTGEKVDPSILQRRAIAVVIENYPDARPQSGYNDADIVYETLAEGGITRTMAIFQSKDSNEIGPVRSARPGFVEWAMEYGAVFAHVGGSDEALALINQLGTADLNQFYNGDYFWRATDRYAPHNVYTTTAKLEAAAKANGYDTTKAPSSPFKFIDDAKESDRPATQTVNIDFSSSDYYVTYNYDQKSNSYLRSVAGVKAADKNTGVQVAPKNVIAIYTPMSPYYNSSGKLENDITVVGSGTGYLFQNGKQIQISWSKSSDTAPTVFTDASGAAIQLVRGQTWIEVVPSNMSITAS
jgi:hypothetical protein